MRVVLHFKGKAWRRQLTFGYLFWGLKRKTRRTSVKIEEALCNTKYLVLFPGQKGLKLKSFRNNGLIPKILHFNRKIEKEHLCQKCNTSGLNSNFTSTEHGTISYSVFHSLRRLLSYFPLLLYISPFWGRLSSSSLLAFSFSYLPSNGSLPVLFASLYS